nr:DUF4238 domain-containing protein [uncultured Devosia sp.]
MKQATNLPLKHHFVPEFYLKAWMGDDKKVTEFRKWPARISIRRAHPAATGFVDRLYTLEGLPDETAQELETGFFGPVDGRAATAHVNMREGRLDGLTDVERVGWSIFMNSMLMRTPQDLAIVRGKWLDILFEGNADWEARFSSTRTEGEPFTLKEAAEAIPVDELKRSALRTLVAVMSGRNIVQTISSMRWEVFPAGNADLSFMTSDAPVIRTNGIGRPEGFSRCRYRPMQFSFLRNVRLRSTALRACPPGGSSAR